MSLSSDDPFFEHKKRVLAEQTSLIETLFEDHAIDKAQKLGLPILLFNTEELTLIYANESAVALFESSDLALIAQRLLAIHPATSERLRLISRMVLPGSSPRLERLRMPGARSPGAMVTLICTCLFGQNHKKYLSIIILGSRIQGAFQSSSPSFSKSEHSPERGDVQKVSEPRSSSDQVQEVAKPFESRVASRVASTGLSGVSGGETSLVPHRDDTFGRQAGSKEHSVGHSLGPCDVSSPSIIPSITPTITAHNDFLPKPADAFEFRFTWRSESNHCLQAVSDVFAQAIGIDQKRLLLQSFTGLDRLFSGSSANRLAAIFASQQTFSGVDLEWQLFCSGRKAKLRLGGAPKRDQQGNFQGFLGYGVLKLTPAQLLLTDDKSGHELSISLPTLPRLFLDQAVGHVEDDLNDNPSDSTTRKSVGWVRDFAHISLADASDRAKDVSSEPKLDRAEAELSSLQSKVIPLRPLLLASKRDIASANTNFVAKESEDATLTPDVSLTNSEQNNFTEIARSLQAQLQRAIQEQSETSKEAVHKLSSSISRPSAGEAIESTVVSFPEVPAELECKESLSAGSASEDSLASSAFSSNLASEIEIWLNRLPIALMLVRGGIALFANRALLELLGYENLQQFTDEHGLAQMFTTNGAERALDISERGRMEVSKRSGETFAADVHMQLVDWRSSPASLISLRSGAQADDPKIKALADDADHARAEAAELNIILDTAIDGVVLMDDQARIVAINRSGEALFGYDRQELIGAPYIRLFAYESQQSAREYLDGLKQDGVASLLNGGREVIGRASKGGAIPLSMTLGRIGSGSGMKFCAVLRDITQWKKAEKELSQARRSAEEANAHKSDFLAKVSHEIRTPLNAILGFAEVIMDERFGAIGNERYKEYLKDIYSSGKHVMSLINDLLDLSKIEAGKMELEFSAVDFNKVISECVSIMQPSAAHDKIVVRQSLASNLPKIVADERSLKQIVLNLISNAFKFNTPGGQVIVSTALTDRGYAVIRVRDTGIGMNESEIELAMEPFRQLRVSQQSIGTGLGLPLTKALVEANRASLTIKSRRDEGTLVEVAFPPTRVLAE